MSAMPPSDPDTDPRNPFAGGPDDGALHRATPRMRRMALAASLALFALAAAVLFGLSSEIDAAEVRAAVFNVGWGKIGLAAAFTCVSYLLLTGYDFLALRHLGSRLPYRTMALGSFASYAVSFTLGFPLVTAAAVRFAVYAPKGLSAGDVARVTLIAGVTFWLGMGVVLGTALIAQGPTVSVLGVLPAKATPILGGVVLIAITAYVIWVSRSVRTITVRGWRLRLPGAGVTLGQASLGALDVCAGAAVLFVLLPPGVDLAFETFVAIYVVATLMGIASHAPGGIGVFEATILIALSWLPREPVLGALLMYRLIYYLAPFLTALLLLGCAEVMRRITRSRDAAQPAVSSPPDDPDLR